MDAKDSREDLIKLDMTATAPAEGAITGTPRPTRQTEFAHMRQPWRKSQEAKALASVSFQTS